MGGGGGGQSTSGPIYEKWEGQSTSGPIYEKGGNLLQVRYEKWGGGGGQSASGPIPLFGTQKILYRYINGYKFDQGGGLKHFTRARARMNLIVVFNCIHS